jgi:hypothetical protein
MALQFVTRQLADSIITTAKLAADSVTADKLANGAVDTAAVLDANITTAKLAAAAVTAAKADLTGTWNFSSGTLSAANPSADSHVATKLYVDSVAQGIKWKQPARVLASSNIDISTGLTNGSTVDGVTLSTGNRVLLIGQTDGKQNGVYVVVASGAASRSTDLDNGVEFPSAAIFVSEGTAADTGWTCTDNAVTLGTTAITFVQFTGLGSVTAGAGLTKTGNTLDVNVGSGVQISNDAVAIKLGASNPALSFDGGGGLQLQVKANSGIEADGSGIFVKVKANSGIVADSSGVSVSLEANKGLEFSGTGGLQVKTANGVQVDGSGFVSIKLDGATLATSGTGVKIADGGVGTTQIAGGAVATNKLADNAVTLAKAGFRPYAESFSGGTALAYDLGQDIRSEFYPGVLVAFNGQLLAKVASNPGEGEFVVDRNGGTSKTRITLGGTAPSASDTITANYLG